MLQARIVSPRASFYFAAQATPCSLPELHRHVRKMHRRFHGHGRLSLSLGGSDVGVGVAAGSAFLRRITSEGATMALAEAHESSGTLGLPGSGGPEARLAGARSDEHGARSGAPPTIERPRP
jgi:hypothetical protein